MTDKMKDEFFILFIMLILSDSEHVVGAPTCPFCLGASAGDRQDAYPTVATAKVLKNAATFVTAFRFFNFGSRQEKPCRCSEKNYAGGLPPSSSSCHFSNLSQSPATAIAACSGHVVGT